MVLASPFPGLTQMMMTWVAALEVRPRPERPSAASSEPSAPSNVGTLGANTGSLLAA